MGFLEILLGLGLAPPLLFIIAVGVGAWWWFGGMMEGDADRAYLANWAESETWRVVYRRTLAGALDRLDRFWAPNHLAEHRAPTSPARAWNWRLYNFCLLLAMAYPLLSVIGVWALTGEAGRVGYMNVIPAEEDVAPRAGVVVALVFQIAVMIYAFSTKGWRKLLAVVGVVAVATYFSNAGAAVVGVAAGVAAVAVAGAITSAGAGAFTIALAAAFAGSLAVFDFIYFALAAAVALTFLLWAKRSGRQDVAVFMLSIGYFLALLAILRFFTTWGNIGPDTPLFITFLVLLPFVNAVFDYGSLGLTRWCLRKGLESRLWGGPILWWIIDLLAALALFMALGAAMIWVVHITQLSDGYALINLPAFFADLKANPSDYWWLYITLFSTLLPTFLHMCLALFSFGWMWPGFGARLAGRIRSGRWPAKVKARMDLTLLTVCAVALPLVLIGAVIYALGGNAHIIALWFFEQFEQIALWMGAL